MLRPVIYDDEVDDLEQSAPARDAAPPTVDQLAEALRRALGFALMTPSLRRCAERLLADPSLPWTATREWPDPRVYALRVPHDLAFEDETRMDHGAIARNDARLVDLATARQRDVQAGERCADCGHGLAWHQRGGPHDDTCWYGRRRGGCACDHYRPAAPDQGVVRSCGDANHAHPPHLTGPICPGVPVGAWVVDPHQARPAAPTPTTDTYEEQS